VTVTPHFGDDGRSGAYGDVSGRPDGPEAVWLARTEAPVVASPVLADATLVVVDISATVYAFDAVTGAARWRQTIREYDWDGKPETLTAPTVWNSWVIAENGNGKCAILDLQTGEPVRTLKYGGCPTVAGDLLLLADVGEMRAYSLPNLELQWRTNGRGWLQTSPAVSPDGIAYATLGFEPNHTHGGVDILDLNTGELLKHLDGSAISFPDDASGQEEDEDEDEEEDENDWGDDEQAIFVHQTHAVLAEGRMWMPAYREDDDWTAQVIGLSPQTGEQVWGYVPDPAGHNEVDSAVAVADGTVYLVEISRDHPPKQDEARLHAVDIDTGRVRWIRAFGAGAGSPVVADQTVYVATRTGTVSAFDTETGDPRWTVETGEEILHPAFVDDLADMYHDYGLAVLPADGMVYVRTHAGVVALR
jgi:outer membrane protein assembly factor BamB